jgi:ankyrin repeat protein
MFSKAVKASLLGTSGNTKPLKDLQDRGQVVQDISRSSVDRVKKLYKILTFVEMRKMPYLNFRVSKRSKFRNMAHNHIQVVSEDSATLNVPNEERFYMNANHRNICKFENMERPYIQVWTKIKSMSDALLLRVFDQMQRDLASAVSAGDETKVKDLIERGVDPDSECQSPRPLWLATSKGHTGVLKMLLDTKRVDIEAPNLRGGGERAIHLPCIWGSGGRGGIDAVDAMLVYGANINSTTADNWSPLHEAIRFHGSEDLVRFLIKRGADIEARTVIKETPLHLAADGGSVGKIKILMEAHAKLDALDAKGRIPESTALENGHTEAARLLETERIRRAAIGR